MQSWLEAQFTLNFYREIAVHSKPSIHGTGIEKTSRLVHRTHLVANGGRTLHRDARALLLVENRAAAERQVRLALAEACVLALFARHVGRERDIV